MSARWKRAILGLSAVVLIGAGATVASRSAQDRTTDPAATEACTLGRVQGADVAATPEAAFNLWWDTVDQEQFARSHQASVADIDFEREGQTYRWEFGPGRWVKVEIDHPRAGDGDGPNGWTVTGINDCWPVDMGNAKPVG